MKIRGGIVLIALVATFSSQPACGVPAPLVVPPPTTALPPPPSAAARATGASEAPRTRLSDKEDSYHGTTVRDPYRWLEDGESDEVRTWTEAQNAHTRSVLARIPGREALGRNIASVLSVGFANAPVARGEGKARRYFHTRRTGAQNQPVLYVREEGKDRVLLDPSELSRDGTTSLDWWFPSADGKLLAWGSSESGSEESTLHVRDVALGKDMPDTITRTRHASVAWLRDGSGFYYTRYPAPGSVPAGDEKYGSKVFFHRLGSAEGSDELVFGDGRDKTDTPIVGISADGRWLMVTVHMGWDKNEVYVRDLKAKPAAPFVTVAKGERALYGVSAVGDQLYIVTNDGAPKYRLMRVPFAKAGDRKEWKEVLKERTDVLDDVAFQGNDLFATYLHDGATQVSKFGLDGKPRGEIKLPTLGTAHLVSSEDRRELFLNFTSFVVPQEAYIVEKGTSLKSWDSVSIGSSAEGVTVSRLYATSKDGTRVPMFVVRGKGAPEGKVAPTILYGYGGFNVSQLPSFSPRVLATAMSGAVWTIALLRGGGEFGEGWHRAGMLASKQNVFDDFYACAETLIKNKVTDTEHLAAWGGSNGGLLVATAITQRPELFRAAASLVPLTDMLRYHHFRIAKLWIPEYGSSDDRDQFKTLAAYSPYHHVKEATRYPSVMFTTAESDSRVDPMHARKMAARVQAAQSDRSRPVLLRVESKAGHGAGKPITKLVEELTDELSFVLHEIGAPSAEK